MKQSKKSLAMLLLLTWGRRASDRGLRRGRQPARARRAAVRNMHSKQDVQLLE